MSLPHDPQGDGDKARSDAAIPEQASVWDRFSSLLRQRGVGKPFDRWFVLRAEQFQKALPNEDLGACSADDVIRYRQRTTLREWQYRQVVDALELLLTRALELPWAAAFDWTFWRESASRLEPGHATIARELPQEGLLERPPIARVGRTAPPVAHEALLPRVTAEIRRRAYSIRTEQAYVHWIRRFTAHFRNRTSATAIPACSAPPR